MIKKLLLIFLWAFLVFFTVFFTAACSFDSTSKVTSNDGMPFQLKVSDEVFDGKTLYIRAKVQVLTPWDLSYVSLKLNTYQDGKRCFARDYPMRDLIKWEEQGGLIPVGDYDIALSADVENATDYQLELAWNAGTTNKSVGERHRVNKNKNDGELIVENAVVVEQESCAGRKICDGIMEVRAEVKNISASDSLKEIVLKIIFVGKNVNYEQLVPLEDVVLAPEESYKLDLNIEAFDYDELLELKPVITVVSFEK